MAQNNETHPFAYASNCQVHWLQINANSEAVFQITPDGEIEKDGKNITDDDAAVAECLREWCRLAYGIKVRSRNCGGKEFK